MCCGGESNSHGILLPLDFKSNASTNSATAAYFYNKKSSLKLKITISKDFLFGKN